MCGESGCTLQEIEHYHNHNGHVSEFKNFAVIDSEVETESAEWEIVNCIEEIGNRSESTYETEIEERETVPISNISNQFDDCASLRKLQTFL